MANPISLEEREVQRRTMVDLLVECGWSREKADERSLGWDQIWGGPRIVLSLADLADTISGALTQADRLARILAKRSSSMEPVVNPTRGR